MALAISIAALACSLLSAYQTWRAWKDGKEQEKRFQQYLRERENELQG